MNLLLRSDWEISDLIKYNHKREAWEGAYPLPNVKRLIRPDPGFLICDADLEQADARVVAWTADSPHLKAVFKNPLLDLHTENAILIFGSCDGKKDPRRQKAKAGCHATNYGATAPTLAKALGCSVAEAQAFQDKWFAVNPQILKWHTRVRHDLQTKRMIFNQFGYRRFFLGRIDNTAFNEALAWEPQSTVGILINKVWDKALTKYAGLLTVRMQVHDSLVFQFHPSDYSAALAAIHNCFQIPIPFPNDPLIITPGKPEVSSRSWGHCIPMEFTSSYEDFREKEREQIAKERHAQV